MIGEIIASNDLLKERAESLRLLFDAGHSLRLFENDFEPLVSSVIGAFAEASYPGYARVNMAGQWRAVFKVIDGEWQFSSNDVTFTSTGPSNVSVFGWFLVGSNKVKLSCRLPFPVLMTTGKSLTVRADVLTWATAIL